MEDGDIEDPEAVEVKSAGKGKKGKKGLMAASIMASRAMASGKELAEEEPILIQSDSEEEETMQLTNADMADSKRQHVEVRSLEQPLSEGAPEQAMEPTVGKRTNGSTAKKRGKKKGSTVGVTESSVSGSTGTKKRRQRGRGQGM